MTFKEQLNEARKRMGVARLGMLLVAGILMMILTWYGAELGKLFPLGFGVIGLLIGLVLRESSADRFCGYAICGSPGPGSSNQSE